MKVTQPPTSAKSKTSEIGNEAQIMPSSNYFSKDKTFNHHYRISKEEEDWS